MKTLVILSQYKAVPAGTRRCARCAFDNNNNRGTCPDVDCTGIIWEKIKTDEEVLEDE